GEFRTASFLRAERTHVALECKISEPARTCGSMRCACEVVLSDRGLPHLRNGADCRRRRLRPRAAGSARNGRRAYLLLPASWRGDPRLMTGRLRATEVQPASLKCGQCPVDPMR